MTDICVSHKSPCCCDILNDICCVVDTVSTSQCRGGGGSQRAETTTSTAQRATSQDAASSEPLTSPARRCTQLPLYQFIFVASEEALLIGENTKTCDICRKQILSL